ncbi:MAG: hypothetical protein RMA76_15225 [Deltaproteobacteria bacterium]|jgi:hypothetical protein
MQRRPATRAAPQAPARRAAPTGGPKQTTQTKAAPQKKAAQTKPTQATQNNATQNKPTAPAAGDARQDKSKPATAPQQGGFGAFLQGLQNKAQNIAKAVKPELSAQEREAAERMRTMLEPNKLGGADKTFNYGDVDAVTQGLLRDSRGLGRRAAQQLNAEGKPFQARLAQAGMNGERGPLKRIARNKVYQQAPGQIRGELSRGLQDARIDPNTRNAPDHTPRNLTFSEVEQFQRDAQVMQSYQKQLSQRLGLDIQFPGGVSQASIDHLLSGALGVPPGAKITPLGDK